MSMVRSNTRQTEAMNDILRLMAEGYILLQAITYDDREASYRLASDLSGYSEVVAHGLALKIIASGQVETQHSSNWRRWKLRKK